MEDGDTEKYHVSSLIQDFVFSSCKKGCIGCISWQVYNKIEFCTFHAVFMTLLLTCYETMHIKVSSAKVVC